MFKIKINQQGFTALELITVASIMAVLLTLTIANFKASGNRTSLEYETEKIVSVIRQAQIWSITGQTVAGSRYAYGVHLSQCVSGSCTYVLFKDSETAGNGTYDVGEEVTGGTYTLSSGIYIESVIPTASNNLDIIFTAPLGTIYFNNARLVENASIVIKSNRFTGQKEVTVNNISGQIDVQ